MKSGDLVDREDSTTGPSRAQGQYPDQSSPAGISQGMTSLGSLPPIFYLGSPLTNLNRSTKTNEPIKVVHTGQPLQSESKVEKAVELEGQMGDTPHCLPPLAS